MYYSNTNIEEFDRYVEFLGKNYTSDISDAEFAYVDLEAFIFGENISSEVKLGFVNHNLTSRELNDRFNKLLYHFSEFEKKHPGKKQHRYLLIDLIDVESSVEEDLFRWSYYSHRFAASQGQDQEAMNEWHKLEQKLDVNKIARFKARRENNVAHYMHIIKNHQFFDEIIFTGIHPRIKIETKYGLDVAEETYINKIIKEQNASMVCSIVDYKLSSPVLNLLRHYFRAKKIKLKGHIVSNSKKLNPFLLTMLRSIFAFADIQEVSIEASNFTVLVNDLDVLSVIPIVDTDKPIFAIDLSQPSTPNFSYLLLKDDGFDQVYGYAKQRINEKPIGAFVRAMCCGLMYFALRRKFVEQMAINYMDDYFLSLANSVGKSLNDFKGPIELLTLKLDSEYKNSKS
jgi:hypothetical protein